MKIINAILSFIISLAIVFSRLFVFNVFANNIEKYNGDLVLWKDDFDDGKIDNVGDFFGWGSPFSKIEEHDGSLFLSRNSNVISSNFIQSPFPDDYFPKGTEIRIRMRVNSDASVISNQQSQLMVYEDERDSYELDLSYYKTNEWFECSYFPGTSFRYTLFELRTLSNLQPDDTIEIDWIKYISSYRANFVGSPSSYDSLINVPNGWPGGDETFEIGDLNNDGKKDLLMSNWNDGVYVYLGNFISSDGDISDSNYSYKFTGVNPDYDSVEIGDVNGNKINDLVICHYNGVFNENDRSCYIVLDTILDLHKNDVRNVLDITSPSNYSLRFICPWMTGNSRYYSGLLIRDVNSDGYTDLILRSQSFDIPGGYFVIYSSRISDLSSFPGNSVLLSNSSSYNLKFKDLYLLEDNQGFLEVGDLNSDNINDVVIVYGYQGILALINGNLLGGHEIGQGVEIDLAVPENFSVKITSSDIFGKYGAFAVGDVNGDGRDEVVTSNKNSLYLFGYNVISPYFNGTGKLIALGDFNSYSASFYHYGYCCLPGEDNTIKIGDVNEDGKDDLVFSVPYDEPSILYVMFSTKLDDYDNSFNNDIDLLSNESAYNLRIIGNWYSAYIGQAGIEGIRISDTDGDGFGNLVFVGPKDFWNWGGFIGAVDSDYLASIGEMTGNTRSVTDWSIYNQVFFPDIVDYGYTALAEWGPFEAGDITGDGMPDVVVPVPDEEKFYVFIGGGKIMGLASGMRVNLILNSTIDPTLTKLNGVHGVRLFSSDIPIADIEVDFSKNSSKNWSLVNGASDVVAGKVYVNNLETAPGASKKHSIYVPKLPSYNKVHICPNAKSMDEVNENCQGGVSLSSNTTDVSIVNLNGQEFWKVDGLTGTGGMNLFVKESDQNTLSETGQSNILLLFVAITTILFKFVLNLKKYIAK